MASKLFETVKKYYLEGYGVPKKYYSDSDLAAFVKSGIITEQEKDEILSQKAGD